MNQPPQEYWSSDGRFGVRVEHVALNTILSHCRSSGRRETGGVLVGKYSEDRRLAIVRQASAPPPDSRAGGFWLVRGIKGLHSWLERLWQDDAGHYVGEWHFHPFAEPTPSHQDIAQMKRIAKTESYHCEQPILFILGGDPAGHRKVRVEVHTRSGERLVLAQMDDPVTAKLDTKA